MVSIIGKQISLVRQALSLSPEKIDYLYKKRRIKNKVLVSIEYSGVSYE